MSEIESEARASYRIAHDAYWRVEALHKGEWILAFYCQDEATAKRSMEDCVRRRVKYAQMSPDERLQSILR